jgi:hypothetical protein
MAEKKELESVSLEKMLDKGEKIILRDGKEYKFSPILLEDLPDFIKLTNGLNLRAALAFLDPKAKDDYIKALKMCFKYNHPDLTEKDILALVDTATCEEIMYKVINLSDLKKV